MNPFLSIVVAAYNAEECLARCLDSVCVGLPSDVEVIVVDDGSTDGTATLAQRYVDEFGCVLVRQENAGAGAARNVGIDVARGSWIWFVDADDRIERGFVGRLEQLLMSRGKGLDFVVFGFVKMRGGRETRIAEPRALAWESVAAFRKGLDRVFRRVPFNPLWNKMFRLDVIKECGIQFGGALSGEDASFVLDYVPHVRRALLLPDAPYFYELESTSPSRTWRTLDRVYENSLVRLKREADVFAECSFGGRRTHGINVCRFCFSTLRAVAAVLPGHLARNEWARALDSIPGFYDMLLSVRDAPLPPGIWLMRMLCASPLLSWWFFVVGSRVRQAGRSTRGR